MPDVLLLHGDGSCRRCLVSALQSLSWCLARFGFQFRLPPPLICETLDLNLICSGDLFSPGLCWQSRLAGAYWVGNLGFKSARASAEFSPGAVGGALILEYVFLGVIRTRWLSR